MDPDATLARIARHLQQARYAHACRARRELQEWLDRGGFAPDWDKHPQAARFVRNGDDVAAV